MDLNTFLVTVYCQIDDWLKTQPRVRQRGPQPVLTDSEVLTMEVVGAYLGIATDQGLYRHFCRDYAEWFPRVRQVTRVTFVRQAANLWQVKARLWQHLLRQVAFDPAVSVVDSLPVPVCRLGRAHRARRLREWSARSEEHTSELQSRPHLVCRLLLEIKNCAARDPPAEPIVGPDKPCATLLCLSLPRTLINGHADGNL